MTPTISAWTFLWVTFSLSVWHTASLRPSMKKKVIIITIIIIVIITQTDKLTDRDRQTDIQTDRQSDIHTYRPFLLIILAL